MDQLTEVKQFEARLSESIGALNAAQGQVVALVDELLDRELWSGGGHRSPEHWLSVRAGVSFATARNLVAVARRRSSLPAVISALERGVLGLDHAVLAARFAPDHVDEEVARFAGNATVSQFRGVLSRYWRDDPDGGVATPDDPAATPMSAAERAATAPGSLSTWHDEHGRFQLRVEAPVDEGARIEAALAHARDILFHDPARPRDEAVTGYGAFVELCSRSSHADDGAGQTARARRDRFGAYLHLSTDGTGWLGRDRAVPPSLARKITCDGAVRPVWHTDGVPVSVGRAHRVAPHHTRRLVIDRDNGCRFPGCGAPGHLEVHHIVHWADGGPTDTHNLTALCPRHHDSHHRGEFTVTGNADKPLGHRQALTFRDGSGRSIDRLRPTPPDHPPRPPDGPGFAPRRGERFAASLMSFPPRPRLAAASP